MSNKKPDFSNLVKRFDLNNIVGSIKSLVNPTGETPDVDPSDAIGVKIAQLSVLAQQLSKLAAEQAKEYNKLNQLLNGLYEDIERLRQGAASSSSSPHAASAQPTAHSTTMGSATSNVGVHPEAAASSVVPPHTTTRSSTATPQTAITTEEEVPSSAFESQTSPIEPAHSMPELTETSREAEDTHLRQTSESIKFGDTKDIHTDDDSSHSGRGTKSH